ncbi:AAA family ATPase [Streptococcus canis]|uniref:AAA family ATPase n=1 Tax=Streptococcus canis TaxID=1329 RepID=UPI003B6738BD
MVKVGNLKSYSPIDLKLGIKSSMPNARQAVALLLLLGLISSNRYELSYSTESNGAIEISDDVFELLCSKVGDILSDNNISLDDFRNIVNSNQLFKSQIEALIVMFELCYEFARFTFNDSKKTFSAERTGGVRFAKTIYFTSNIDYVELLCAQNEINFYSVLLHWLGLPVAKDLTTESQIIKLLTLQSEKALYKLVSSGDIIFNNQAIYETLLEDGEADIDSDVESKGSLRILPSILKDNLNTYLTYQQGIVKSKVSDEVLFAYSKRLDKFFELETKKDSIRISEDSLNQTQTTVSNEERATGGENVLFYGVPGSGKSYTLEERYGNEHMTRVVFHPDYMNTDFIGQILPTVKEDKTITYEFSPGPFTKVMGEAYKNPETHYYLVIEEINRGNAPAIFGEIFQLLDRTEDGTSKYSVVNYDISKEIFGNETTPIKIPSNLTLLGTMNTSDQNVFTLDTAFQRRWNMQMIVNDISKAEHKDRLIADTSVSWGAFNEVINNQIIASNANMLSSEDKRLGAYFISPSDLERKDIDRRFSEKVIKYLWDDAFKFSRDKLFNTNVLKSLESVIIEFTSKSGDQRFNIFKDDVKIDLLSRSLPTTVNEEGHIDG